MPKNLEKKIFEKFSGKYLRERAPFPCAKKNPRKMNAPRTPWPLQCTANIMSHQHGDSGLAARTKRRLANAPKSPGFLTTPSKEGFGWGARIARDFWPFKNTRQRGVWPTPPNHLVFWPPRAKRGLARKPESPGISDHPLQPCVWPNLGRFC